MSLATTSFTKLWGLYTINGRYNNVLFLVEPQLRLVNREGVYEQLLINEGIGFWARNNLQLWLGQTIVNNNPSNDIAEDISNVITGEYRLWQQLSFFDKNILGHFQFRNRLEERHPENSSIWSIRFRDRIYWTIPLAKNQSLYISDEFFINVKTTTWITTKTFDQNRLFLGIQQQVTPKLSFTISYLNQYLTRTPAEIDHGIVFNLIYTVPDYFQ
jgi:hypothetical protein